MWPSAGEAAAARLMAPITMRMTGYVLPNEKSPPRIWSSRKSTPTVMMAAGPISPRIVQRRHAHRIRSLIKKSLLRPAVQPIAHHQNARADQNSRPKKLGNPVPGKPIKIVEQQQDSRADQKNRPDRALFAKSIERVGQGLAGLPRFCREVGINGHVDPKSSDADPQSRFSSSAHRTVNTADEEHQEDGEVNHSFAVLLVIEGAHPRQKSQEKSQNWTRSGVAR